MKVKATKTMVKTLNKALKEREKSGIYSNIDRFEYDDTLTARMYSAFVGDIFTADDYGDYDLETCTFKAVRVVYNPDCYSVNRYISTEDLNRYCRESDKTLEGFINTVFDAVEI